jgi:hypothetical protein
MDEDGEGPKIKCRKIKCLLQHFMPSLPPTLPRLHSHSHASCQPQLVVVLPLFLCRLSFLSCHCLPFGGASISPYLIVPPPLVVPLFFSGALASHPPWLFRVSPLVMPPSPIYLRLRLSSHCHLSLHPSCVSCLAVAVLPFILPMPPFSQRLQLSSRRCLWLCPSHASCPLWLVAV